MLALVARLFGHKGQVRTVKTGNADERIAQSEQAHDVLPHGIGRGRGERADRRALGHGGEEICDFAVARTEILPPLGNAVRLIDCDECKRHALEQVLQAGEPLRGRRRAGAILRGMPARIRCAARLRAWCC